MLTTGSQRTLVIFAWSSFKTKIGSSSFHAMLTMSFTKAALTGLLKDKLIRDSYNLIALTAGSQFNFDVMPNVYM